MKLLFSKAERAALLPLPLARFPCFQEGKRKVNRDGDGQGSLVCAAEYLKREVWAWWDAWFDLAWP